MTWTTPRTWADGDDLSGSVLNLHLKDQLFALYSPPSCNVYTSTGVASIPSSGTATLVPLDSELWDQDWGPGSTGSFHSTVSNTSRVVFPYTGIYELLAYWQWASVPGTGAFANVRLNAAGAPAGGTSLRTPVMGADRAGSFILRRQFSAGDYVELFMAQTSGAAIALTGGAHVTGLSARWLGA